VTKSQFRSALEQLGLSHGAAAKFLGVSLRSVAGWAIGEQPVPTSVALLLQLMLDRGLTAAEVEEITRAKRR
jgi:predicted transcriptional regulator